MKDNIFTKDIQVLQLPDSLRIDKSQFSNMNLLDSVSNLDIRTRNRIWASARSAAHNSRNSLTFDESTAKVALSQLYRSKNDWHRKLAVPVSVLIFFLIGAPLGAIIRKGGLGTPIVISVAFFVLIVGGFLGIVTKTGALDAGISSVVKKLKGKELILIPILMVIFSLGGTSYGRVKRFIGIRRSNRNISFM